jgi:ribosome-associated heat shock protein Hsp15
VVAEAVCGGKVEINVDRPKPSRVVRARDRVNIRRGPYPCTIIINDVSHLRGSACPAQQLYEETDETRHKREAAIAQLKLVRPAA